MPLTSLVNTTQFSGFPYVLLFSEAPSILPSSTCSAFISPLRPGNMSPVTVFQSPLFFGNKKSSCNSSYKLNLCSALPSNFCSFFLFPFTVTVLRKTAPTCCLYNSSPFPLTYCDLALFLPSHSYIEAISLRYSFSFQILLITTSASLLVFMTFSSWSPIFQITCVFHWLPSSSLFPNVNISQDLIFSPVLSLYFLFFLGQS